MRSQGSGSIYQRTSDGLWLAVVEVGRPGRPRRRRTFASTSRAAVEDKLARWRARHPARVLLPDPLARRAEIREAPNAHTPEEWRAKVVATPDCPYCGVRLGARNEARDHRIPVARGGDDSIDNVTPCCRSCNSRKGTMTDAEYMARLKGRRL